MNTGRSLSAKAPARGSFPLDHKGECKDFKERFLQCMSENNNNHYECRDFSKDYLQCRMSKNLMAQEDLDSLGFSKDVKIVPAKEEGTHETGEIIAGLALARSRDGFSLSKLFGGGGSGRGGANHG